jgi:hypothetical protein
MSLYQKLFPFVISNIQQQSVGYKFYHINKTLELTQDLMVSLSHISGTVIGPEFPLLSPLAITK